MAPRPSYFSQEPSEQDIVFFNQHFVQCRDEGSCISWETYGMVQHFMNKGCEFPGRFSESLLKSFFNTSFIFSANVPAPPGCGSLEWALCVFSNQLIAVIPVP